MFRLAMVEYAQDYGKQLQVENEALKASGEFEPSLESIRKTSRAIDRAFRKRSIVQTSKNIYRSLNKVAVVIVIVMAILSVTAMAVDSLRTEVLNFLIGFEKEYTSLRLDTSKGNNVVGDNLYVSWSNANVPTYIPEGYQIVNLLNGEYYKSIAYENTEGLTESSFILIRVLRYYSSLMMSLGRCCAVDEYVVLKYIRLSSDDSYTDSMSIENQRLMLDKYIADMDIPSIKALEFVDNGYSGTNFERPAVQELLDYVRAGKANCIIVKDFSRFGRNAIETGYFLERVFPLYRTRFISVCDYYDSDEHEGGTGGIEVALKFLVHEYYSRDLSKKIKAAKHERMLRGECISKNCAFGYRKTSDNRLEINTDAADTVRLIYNLYAESKSLSAITEALYEQKKSTPAVYKKHKRIVMSDIVFDYVWEHSVLLKILHDEQYIGTYIAGKTKIVDVGSHKSVPVKESEWVRIPNHHPAIISNELFDNVQSIISAKRKPSKLSRPQATLAAAPRHSLKGKVVCGCCGHTMRLSITAFQCVFTSCAPDAACYRHRILKKELENTLFEIISKQAQVVLNVDTLDEVNTVTSQSSHLCECKRLIEQADSAKCDLYEQFILGEIKTDEYKRRKSEIDTDVDHLNRAYAALADQILKEQSTAEGSAKLREVVSGECGLSQSVVDSLIEKVRVFPDNRIEIEWKIADLFDSAVKSK